MRLLLFALLLCILATALAKKRHHEKKHHHKTTTTTESTSQDELDMMEEDDNLVEPLSEEEEETKKKAADPCANIRCSTGKECEVDETGLPTCVCIRRCAPEVDERRKVCSNHNETWDSDCDVYRMRCLCDQDSEDCLKESYKHVHVDYYGICRDIALCTPEEMVDFPRRMRDWLFNVMKDMADRNELDPDYVEMEREAERSIQHRWVNAVIWKFCDLDSHPHDRSVSRHELFPIRAPLLAMEHCIAPFLNGCDENDDHRITLAEWGHCLGLEEGEIQDKCPK
jgi:secreted protein acidic and rich in cysteine